MFSVKGPESEVSWSHLSQNYLMLIGWDTGYSFLITRALLVIKRARLLDADWLLAVWQRSVIADDFLFLQQWLLVSWKPTEKIPQSLCPLCDKQVITRSLGKLRITFVFKVVPKLPESQSDQGNFGATFKLRMTLILNYPRAHQVIWWRNSEDWDEKF